MPEGDTIFRAARSLRRALEGHEITGATSTVPEVRARRPERLVGQAVAAVEPRGKHLLIWFDPSDLALHTHMRMTGSWHLYRRGQRWAKPARWARVTLETVEMVAVCFSAPVVALLARTEVEAHPGLAGLGPDVLADEVDRDEVLARLAGRAGWTIGEALLDQRVLAGVGNIYKNELCFIHGLDPWLPVAEVPDDVRAAVVDSAVELLRRNVEPGNARRVTTAEPGPGGDLVHVYGRARRPCPRCATSIRVARQGTQARLTYWCPHCQGPGPDDAPGR